METWIGAKATGAKLKGETAETRVADKQFQETERLSFDNAWGKK